MRGAMVGEPRSEYPCALYHVIARSHRRRDLYHDDMDRLRYLAALRAQKRRYAFRLHAYALMADQVHLLLEPRAASLSLIMGKLHEAYTHGYQRRYGAVGPAFQRRYRATAIDRDSHLPAVVRYVHLSPVRARLVHDPADYPWSGHRAYLDAVIEGLVDTDVVLAMFGGSRAQARRHYRAFVAEGCGGHSRSGGRGVGDRRIVGKAHVETDASRAPRSRRVNPLSLAALLSSVARVTGVPRERITGSDRRSDAVRARRLLVQAGSIHAVPGRDLARVLGRDPALISRLGRMDATERSTVTRLVGGTSRA